MTMLTNNNKRLAWTLAALLAWHVALLGVACASGEGGVGVGTLQAGAPLLRSCPPPTDST